jgi:hypothetical protein
MHEPMHVHRFTSTTQKIMTFEPLQFRFISLIYKRLNIISCMSSNNFGFARKNAVFSTPIPMHLCSILSLMKRNLFNIYIVERKKRIQAPE